MKQLFASYYSKAKGASPDVCMVQTSHKKPFWFRPNLLLNFNELAPLTMLEYFKTKQHDPDWKPKYRKQIEALHKSGRLKAILDQIPENAVFLCFEKDCNDCHRTILAEFLSEKGLAIVREAEFNQGHPIPRQGPIPDISAPKKKNPLQGTFMF